MSKYESSKHQSAAGSETFQEAVMQLLEQVAKRDQKIAERESLLFYTQTRLKEKEAKLHEIETSRLWKIVLFAQKIRIFLTSPNKRRRQILSRGIDLVLSRLRKSGTKE